MARGYGESDCERGRPLDVGRVVVVCGRGEDDQDQYEGDQELDSKGLSGVDGRVHGGHAEAVVAADFAGAHGLKRRENIVYTRGKTCL